MDGGLADSVPIREHCKKANAKSIVILTRNEGYRKKKPSMGETKIYRAAYKKYPNLVRTILRRPFIYNKQMEQIEELRRGGKSLCFVQRSKQFPGWRRTMTG